MCPGEAIVTEVGVPTYTILTAYAISAGLEEHSSISYHERPYWVLHNETPIYLLYRNGAVTKHAGTQP